eukprot:540636_1
MSRFKEKHLFLHHNHSYFLDLQKRKNYTAWSVDDFKHWFWTLEFDDFDEFSITMNESMQEACPTRHMLGQIGHGRLPVTPQRLYNCNYELLYRALYIPYRNTDENMISFTKNIQSFTLIPGGTVQPLLQHRRNFEQYSNSEQYFIVVMIAPINLLSWNKMASLNFAYQTIDPVVPSCEKEIILPPFTRYKFVELDNTGNYFVVYDKEKVQPISTEIFERVVNKWDNIISEEALFHYTMQSANEILLSSGLENYEVEFRYIDVQNSHIADWSEWYKHILPAL